MPESMNRNLLIVLSIVGVFGIITFALAAAILGTMIKRLDAIENKLPPSTSVTTSSLSPPTSVSTSSSTQSISNTTSPPIINSTLTMSVDIQEIMNYLKELQNIADLSNRTRAINTLGFNQTLDYITETLANKTNLNVTRSFFSVKDFAVASNPVLISTIDGQETNYTYSSNADAQFMHVKYSTSSNISDIFELTFIPNGGCTKVDWENASSPTTGRVALIKRDGSCAFADRAAQAPNFNVSGLLFYNHGRTSADFSPLEVSLGQDNALPALFLSYEVGEALADAVLNKPANITVQLGIILQNLPNFDVGNICADTPTGDVTQTIVIGGHSDSVPAGPGINDNGSGSAANLGLAIALARLFQTSTYAKYKYRVRFCWWGAEEVGLLGAKDYVKRASNSTIIGERLNDHLINLNYDMLGSPNYMFGIYDAKTARDDTPPSALPGSNKTTALFVDWFENQNLPWNYTDFSGRSDYGPFLAAGIVAGGLFSGADGIKTQGERDYYDQKLGPGMGGIVGATHDPCYHKACDSIQNINVFAYGKMVQAAAYVLEYLGRQDDLKAWLYPSTSV